MNWFNPEEAMRTGTFTSGTSGSGKTVLNFHFAERLMQAGAIVYIIDPSQAWPKGSSIPNLIQITFPMTVEWKNGTSAQSTIFDVSRLTYPQRVQFAETFCKTIMDDRKNKSYRPPTFVIFEEGQLYFPQGSMRSLKRHSSAVELVTNGRNFNVRFGVITQFPSMIDKLLIKMCKQRYFGWTNEPNDVDYIDDIIGKEHAKNLEKLEVGEFIYSYPVRKGGTRQIKVPMFKRPSQRSGILIKPPKQYPFTVTWGK